MFDGLTFGIEIETIGKTRKQVAEMVQAVVGGQVIDGYAPQVKAEDGRLWKIANDASLTSVPDHLRAEVVSPILTYADLPTVQQIVRTMRDGKVKVDRKCGIHIHIGANPFDGKALGRLAKLVYKQEPLILHALKIQSQRLERYTKPINPSFIAKLEQKPQVTKAELNSLWYGHQNSNPQHYDASRYHGVNLHNVWYRGTVEFRWFEGTLHAGKIKAYVQLVLAIAKKALKSRAASAKAKRAFNPASAKYDFRVFLLRLGMIGDEFKTARQHLLAAMPGDAAFKTAAQRKAS